MKLDSLSVLCLSLILFHTHSSLAKRGGGGGGGKFFGKNMFPAWMRGSGHRNNQGSRFKGWGPKQSGQNNQGGNPPQSGRPGYPLASYPRQQGGVYHNQYPAQGSPYGGGYGVYPGTYINQNPNNKVLSPHYGGSYGYGGYGGGGGSPFSHSVQAMGLYPQDKSRGFGRGAVMSVAGGAMAGMALGYGLGRFPRPHFHFNRPEEEYYYNYYMYRKYGVRSTDTNDYGRDYRYDQPTLTYDRFMDSCMKRTDLLPEVNQKPRNKPAAAAATTTAVVIETNSTAAENSSTSSTQPEAGPVPPASQAVSDAEDEGVDAEDDDDTVSIVEIGYPALIEQLKARRCLELYMVYSEKYLKRQTGGAQGPEMGLPGLLVVVTTGTLLTLLNSNVLTLQRLGLH
ncbi:uncharacterized protein LOC118313750 isoform X2 [Scophthalmus maximus]|nr:uncharacterized protein LOC118313750 isoform X2 [Scophthalmus maximus]